MTNKKDKESPTPEGFKLVPGKPDYTAMYEKAKAEGKLHRSTFRIHTWKEDSAILIGRITDILPFKGGKFEAEVNSYLMDTADGLVSFIMGTYTDSQLEGIDLKGRIVRIEFAGKKDLEDGRSVNQFNVDVLESEV